jgi:alpha-glucoside transport system permease protein
MDERITQILIGLVGIPALLIGYLLVVERLLARLPAPWRPRLRPLAWLGPALLLLSALLAYPMLATLLLSLQSADADRFVGLANYWAVATAAETRPALINTALWLVCFPLGTVLIGLLLAVLTDRVPYEAVAKAIIFVPMAISFVAAAVIWRFVFEYRPPGVPQTGTLNALWTNLVPGAAPQAWLITPPGNSLALIAVGVWMWTGFCLVILSAGLKGIPPELLEAARIDGAGEGQIFLRITVPLLWPTIAVVATTMVITALKTFDIVYVMTNGNYQTDVIATQMYKQLFVAQHPGRASAIAVLLLLALLPVMLLNLRLLRRQEAIQ